jgi:hypothetical protein
VSDVSVPLSPRFGTQRSTLLRRWVFQ